MDDLTFYPYEDAYGNHFTITFAKGVYNNGNLAVIIYNEEPEYGYLEPYADLTVNIEPLDHDYKAAIDTNNLPNEIIDWLEENEIAWATGEELHSGFCTYPVVKFDEQWVEETPDTSEI